MRHNDQRRAKSRPHEPVDTGHDSPTTPLRMTEHPLAGIQHAAGNHAVQQLLAVQRRDARTAGTKEHKRLGSALEKRVVAVATASDTKQAALEATIGKGVSDIDAMLVDLNLIADRYQGAYDSYRRVLERGRAHAAAMDKLSSLIIGTLIGVGVGVSLGLALPLTAQARLLTMVVAQLRNKLTSTIIQEGGAYVARRDTDSPPSGGRENFDRAHPAAKGLEAYRQAAEMYRRLSLLHVSLQTGTGLHALTAALQSDSRELAVSGTHRSLTVEELTRRVAELESVLPSLSSVQTTLDQVGSALEDARIAASIALEDVDVKEMERNIWIHWMASLSGSEAEILGSDPIEDHLNTLGIMAKRGSRGGQRAWESSIGWGVGAWHSRDDSREGARLAQKGARALNMLGQVGTFRHESGSYAPPRGVFVDSSGQEWPAIGHRDSYDLDRSQVVVTRAPPSGSLTVDLPSAAAADRRAVVNGRRLLGTVVDLTGTRMVTTGMRGGLAYRARATSPTFPGTTWLAELTYEPGRREQDIVQATVTGVRRDGNRVTLIGRDVGPPFGPQQQAR